MKKIILLLIILLISIPVSAQENNKFKAVCSTTQIADFVRNISGDRWSVHCILAPGADPHTYMPTPEDVKMVIQADLTFENGLNLEGKNWMASLAKDANKPLITCSEGIQPIQLSEGTNKISDPHAWFSLKNAAIYVNNITKALIKADSAGSFRYEARAKLYLHQLRILDAWIREQIHFIPIQRRILVTSHDAFNYFCYEYKFNENHQYLSLAPIGWSTGSEIGAGMTPQRHKSVIESIQNTGATAVFVETSVNPKLIKEIARESGVQVGGQLYSDSMGEKNSEGETYIGMMRENVITIVEALK